MIILGIDPGTAKVGYGLIRKEKRKIEHLKHGIIETKPEFSEAERLRQLQNQLNAVIQEYKPALMAVERLYFFKNLKTAISVSQAKGVILLTAAKKKIPVFQFTPLQMKITITGYGRAKKIQVQKMVKVLLNLEELPRPDDAADALGVAICCANSIKE